MRRPFLSSKPYYSVDFDRLNEIPIEEIGQQLNMHFTNTGKTFCPDISCTDSNSSHRGASVMAKRNLLHCFCCGGNWNSFTLIGLQVFGLSPKECYTGENIQRIGEYLYENGFSCVEEKEKTKHPMHASFPAMPMVLVHYPKEDYKRIPLYRLIGFQKNPFQQVLVKDKTNEDSAVSREILLSLPAATQMFFEKALEALRCNYELMENPLIADNSNYEAENRVLLDYLPQLYPLLTPVERTELTKTLLYHVVMEPQEAYRQALIQIFPKEMKQIEQALEERNLTEEKEKTDESFQPER